MNNAQWTRRAFLVATTTTAVALMGESANKPNTAKVVPGKHSPNEKVIVGMIGLGGRCRGIVEDCKKIPQMQVVAASDCFQRRIDSFLGTVGRDQNWKGYVDFREMIEKENLDAVMVETTTHARAWVACHAMAMGVDAYIEKPMCLTIAEGRYMVNIARKYGRVTQIGTQQRSIPLNTWASDLVKNGAIGKIKTVLAPNYVAATHWAPQPGQPLPEGGTGNWWDVWTNQAEMRPYHKEIHLNWAKWRDYDGGGISFGVTGWGTHSYDQVQRGLGTDETGPIEIVMEEPMHEELAGKYDDHKTTDEETGWPYYAMVKGLSGNRAKVTMKYANGTELKLHLDADNGPGLGAVFIGEKGKIEINRDMIAAAPKELIAGSDNPGRLKVSENQPHIENWVECIKSRKRCNADVEYGQRATTICYLVNIVRDIGKVGEPLKWDPDKEQFTNSKEANKFLSLPRREGYELPA
jgi:hypothetical protein